MRHRAIYLAALAGISCVGVAVFAAESQTKPTPGKYAVKVPGGIAMAEFRGYESWPVIAISENNGRIEAILGNATVVKAYQEGIPANGKPFPNGSSIAKVHWIPKKQEAYPGQPTVPGAQHDADFMTKDSTRFADSGGWGYAAFEYDPATDTFRPGNNADKPPQGNDAKCGYACHTVVKGRDYVFTEYAHR